MERSLSQRVPSPMMERSTATIRRRYQPYVVTYSKPLVQAQAGHAELPAIYRAAIRQTARGAGIHSICTRHVCVCVCVLSTDPSVPPTDATTACVGSPLSRAGVAAWHLARIPQRRLAKRSNPPSADRNGTSQSDQQLYTTV